MGFQWKCADTQAWSFRMTQKRVSIGINLLITSLVYKPLSSMTKFSLFATNVQFGRTWETFDH